MVLAVKGLGKLSWVVIRSFVGCADKSSWYSVHVWMKRTVEHLTFTR